MSAWLVRALEFGYTAVMHIIDGIWTGLADGYQALQGFKTNLAGEFGRAVRVGQKQQFRKHLTEWQKKRRVFFALVVVALLSIMALCVTSFYFREMACVIVYWAVLVGIILVTLAVAGRQYIREMVKSKPVSQPVDELEVDLEGRWWDSLRPMELVTGEEGKKDAGEFLALLVNSLPESFSGRNLTGSGIVVVGPSGIWVFRIELLGGTILKLEGVWKQIQTEENRPGRKKIEERIIDPGPDDQWLQQKQEILKKVADHLPEHIWMQSLVQGGVVFSHPKVTLDKKQIQANKASYGRPKAWVERMQRAPLVDGFTLEMQLKMLDALEEGGSRLTVSTSEEAERLYLQAVEELRTSVARMVK
jgi:hypothetical protein